MPRKSALMVPYAPDEPNLVVPLATSYNERGVAGYTHTVTNSEDQRKVNCFYEVAKNSATGKWTLTLSKRPGVTIDSQTYGAGTQQSYLALTNLFTPTVGTTILANNDRPWVFSISGNDTRISDGSNTTVILTSALGYIPAHVDIANVSNVQKAVIQLKRPSGTSVQRVWFSSNVTTWTEITDADFTAIVHRGKMEFIDGFAFILGDNNLIWNSDSNSLANWTATSFISKQIQQDYAQGLARYKNQLLAFGDYTCEMFYNAGNTVGSPLGRILQLHQRVGLIPPDWINSVGGGTNYYAIVSDKLYFIGRKGGGAASAGLFIYDGASFEKVSTPYIDKIIGEKIDSRSGSYSYYSINAVVHQGQAAVAICFTHPSATTQKWLMFYPDWKEWFEWNSTVFSPVNSGEFFLGLGSNNHRVYSFSGSDNWQDDGTSYAWSTQFKLPGNGGRFMHMYGVDADTDTSANSLTVEQSTDDSQTFTTLGTIDMTADRKVLFRAGLARKRHIRLSSTNARPTRIHNFIARID